MLNLCLCSGGQVLCLLHYLDALISVLPSLTLMTVPLNSGGIGKNDHPKQSGTTLFHYGGSAAAAHYVPAMVDL